MSQFKIDFYEKEYEDELIRSLGLAAIRKLDGKKFSEFGIDIGNSSISFGGGEEGQVIVTVNLPDADSDQSVPATLLNPEVKPEEIVRTIGGQGTDINRKCLVPVDMAIQAFDYFIENCDLDPSLSWERPQDRFDDSQPRYIPSI